MRPTIRLATNEDGEQIGNLVRSNGFFANIELDWNDIVPHWMVAEKDGAIVGVIQMCPGKPVGQVECLSIDPQIEGREKAMMVRSLLVAANQALAQYGAQMATGFVPHSLKSYRKVLKKRGAIPVDHGAFYAYRLV